MSFKKNIKNLIYEPYFEFMSIEESNIVGGSKEPANTTHEIGIKISKSFSTIKSSISNYKNIFNNDQFYLGTQLLMSEVESGFYSPTGTAKIEEETKYLKQKLQEFLRFEKKNQEELRPILLLLGS